MTRSAVLAGPVVAFMALAACTPAPLTPAPPLRTSVEMLRVDVVGDSLIHQSTPNVQAALGGAGFQYTVSSDPGKDMRSEFVVGALAALEGNGGDVLVVATASNDAIVEARMAGTSTQADAQASYREYMGGVVNRFGDRCVVIVNAKEDVNPFFDPAQATILNGNIREEQPRRANLVIADWASASRAVPPSEFAEDQLHFGPDPRSTVGTKDSARAYAATILAGVRTCERMLRPVEPTTTSSSVVTTTSVR